ncbi:efflux RND transporter periplasmic adaptor subunit [Paenibacillus doosanensis]|uniref:Macrolide transporter subunit MacA n=1 Tax=Paenibacillus konkukensis TaxID=2020716 RepID=A0ABY4RFR0_9BACL|nr:MULTISPECIES: efflux RND transporter periplasmic adaptor subunit [Paenibacillus]MCS7460511.1 efflux RND transporter periplasmic adaptor subunit [Paenibacillus doosanensis]UQZ81267.1 macrolide transporter subunit MacA [Paenibacillus konkukensis]
MQIAMNEQTAAKRKKTIAAIFGCFLTLLLLLTLFSNTLLAMKLPKVNTEQPRKAKLQHTMEGSGTIEPQEAAELTNAAGLKVSKTLVKEGDFVQKGQVLIAFDNKEAERQLQDEQARLRQQQLALEKTQDDYIAARQNGDELAARAANRSLESQTIDIGIQERKIASMQEKSNEQRELKAPFDGTVTKLLEDETLPPSPGQPLIRISRTDKGYKLEIELPASSANLLKTGDKVPVRIDSEGSANRQVEGLITEIEKVESSGTSKGAALSARDKKEADTQAAGPQKRIVISVQGEGIQGGESASCVIVKLAAKESLLIPNGAIKEDGDGSYVYTIRENKGPLGNEFTVEKSYLTKGDANDKETAVAKGLSPEDKIVIESSEPLQEGNRVRLQ